MSYDPAEKFNQPVDGIEVVSRVSGPRTLLTAEAMRNAAARIAAGEDRETVILELAFQEVELLEDLKDDELDRALGGPGSGHFGHEGRPGEVGGSAPGDDYGIGGFTKGGDNLSLSENKAAMQRLIEAYRKDTNLQGASHVVRQYAELDRATGLATRAIVAAALEGKNAETIWTDGKIRKLIDAMNAHRNENYYLDEEAVRGLVVSAPGFYAMIRTVKPTESIVYRGMQGAPRGDEFELRGPTAFSEHFDSAMTYSGGTLMEVEPGAKMLPVQLLKNIERGAGGDEHSTIPSFHRRSDQSVHPRGPGAGYAIDFDTDRELNTAGRFQVVSRGERRVVFTDGKSGKARVKTIKVIRVRQVGVF